MRIVGGAWRGRRLEAPEGRGTRPTTDRVRESLASMVLAAEGLDLSGARVLDAFAGSGAVSLELLSRGAASATLVERDRSALRACRANVAACGARGVARVVAGDAFRLAARGRVPGAPFTVVVLDPPYATPAEQVAELVEGLLAAGAVGEGALVVYERAQAAPPLALHTARIVSRKRHGDTAVDLLRLGAAHGDAADDAAD